MGGLSLGMGMCLSRRSGSGPAFVPSSLFGVGDTGLAYDFTDTSTLFQDTGATTPVTAAAQVIGRVNDISGKGNHATQGTAANKPLYQGWAEFDGVNDTLVTPSMDFSSRNKCTFAWSMRSLDSAFGGVMAFNGDDLTAFDLGGEPFQLRSSVIGDTGNSQMLISGAATGANAVYAQLYDLAGATAADESVNRFNGTAPSAAVQSAGPAGGGNLTAGTYEVGAAFFGAFFKKMRVYRVMVINRLLTGSELTNAERWCGSAAGVSL